jgi:thiol:disulfide interchange protein DsbC
MKTMRKIIYIAFFTIVSCLVNSPVNANPGYVGDCASCHNLTIKEAEALLNKTGGTVTSVKHAPIKGMFELFIEKDGKRGVIYIDYAKKNFMQGFIVNFDTLKKVSSHDVELAQSQQPTSIDIKSMPVKYAIIIGNPQGTKKLYIFTDPDCPYCRQQHEELKKLIKQMPELAVYVMPYPLPVHPDAYDKSRAILTFKDQATLDKAFSGQPLPAIGTMDGVASLHDIINYARRNGLAATPSIVLPDGRVLSGFKSVEELQKILVDK